MSNPFFQEFKKQVVSKHRNLLSQSLSEWVEENTYLKGRRFRLTPAYEFQRAILDDMHPYLTGIKISQVGFTEIQIRKALAFLHKYNGSTLIYTVPDLKMQKQVASTRIKPIVNSSPVLEKREGEVRTNDINQFGDSFLHCAHCVESNATSIPADFIMNDELDLSNQEIVALFNSRLQNSDFKIKQRFSTPTFANFGVDADFRLSDQMEYMIKCPCCGYWQIPDYDWKWVDIPGRTEDMVDLVTDITDDNILNLDLTKAKVVCEKCRKPLNLEENRKWVPSFPNRKNIRGYRIRPFTSSRVTIPYIMTTLNEYRRKKKIRRGVNTILGRPYEDSSSRLQYGEISEAMLTEGVPEIGKDNPVFVGVDVGLTCHITLGTPCKEGLMIFNFLTCPSEILKETLNTIQKNYKVVAGGMDRYPYTPLVQDIRDDSRGKLVPMSYTGKKAFSPNKDPSGALDFYSIDRTFFADLVAENIRRKEMLMLGYKDQGEVLITHLRDMYRETAGEGESRWVKMSGNDHFFHSLIYLMAAYYIKESAYNVVDSPNFMLNTVVSRMKGYGDNIWPF